MPRQAVVKQYLTFIGGLHTEANPLSFPENVSKDLDNVDLSRDGSIKRRRGLDFEEGGGYSDLLPDISTHAISLHEWKSVDNDDDLNFLVIQIGGILYFHQLGEAILSLSGIGSISLANAAVNSDYQSVLIHADHSRGRLYVVSESIDPLYIEYDRDTNTFTGIKLNLKIRDTDGIDEDQNIQTTFGTSTPLTPPSPGY